MATKNGLTSGQRLQKDLPVPVSQRTPKEKKCRVCNSTYQPMSSMQKACSPTCALKLVRAEKHKARKKALTDNDRSYWTKKTQQAFNAYIRARDVNLPCISCGRHHAGQYHAGHYRTTASQPALRFNELNCHKQCSVCNNHKSGNITEYRINLVKKVGESLVEWLEREHGTSAWTVEKLKALTSYYRRAKKEAESYQPPQY